MTPRTQPPVLVTKPGKLPAVVDERLSNGLRVLAARKPGVPMVQARLRVDVAKNRGWGDGVLEDIVGNTILNGTATRSQVNFADDLQRIGAAMSTSVDVEDVYIAGTTLASGLPTFLELLADVVLNASYPEDEVELAKSQAEQVIAIMAGQPAAKAQYAIATRVFPNHPYGRPMPTPDLVAPITRAAARKFHKSMVTPSAALLVLVGDMAPQKMVAFAEKALGGWNGGRKPGKTPTPAPLVPGPIQIVNHPGAVQTVLRLGGIGVGRSHPDYPALSIATTILGGAFGSRLNLNLREDKGYTYGAHAGLAHNLAAIQIDAGADVQTAVTAAALVETMYEVGRMATTPVTDDELESAKRYLAGSIALSIDTQPGLASYLAALAIQGLDVTYLKEFPAAAARLTADDVLAASAKYLAPSQFVTVMVGDAEQIAGDVGRLGLVEVVD